uniref:Germin-like protein n=2 Tax=Noccaea caerulescens TaxID=107243 RepID=A0A1J3F6A6_NOCCA
MPMKNLSFLASLSLLALTFQFAIAADPSQLQDYCVATNTSTNGVFVNGKFCKDLSLATVDDFVFTGLDQPRPVTSAVGATVTPVNVDSVPGLNTLGLLFARVDYAVNGLIPPHLHPRGSEVLVVYEGTILAGFVSSDNNGNRLFSKTLHKGDLIVFPQGLIHFQANVGGGPAITFSAVNSQNPGFITVANTVFGSNPPINATILAKAFQLNITTILDLQAKF